MKLAKTLMNTGVLVRGEVRHCSMWDFPALRRAGRRPLPTMLRIAEARRVRGRQQPIKTNPLQAVLRLFGRGQAQ
jgi:hypothetical protein